MDMTMTDETEEWRAIPDWPYDVSSLGRVRSRHRGIENGRVLRAQPDKDGYLKVNLCDAPRDRLMPVHFLVLLAFVGPRPSPDHEGRHLDRNPGNPRLSNLAWGTREENKADMVAHGTRIQGVAHYRAKIDEKAVVEIRRAWATGKSWRALGKEYGISGTQVGRICRGEFWKHVPMPEKGAA